MDNEEIDRLVSGFEWQTKHWTGLRYDKVLEGVAVAVVTLLGEIVKRLPNPESESSK